MEAKRRAVIDAETLRKGLDENTPSHCRRCGTISSSGSTGVTYICGECYGKTEGSYIVAAHQNGTLLADDAEIRRAAVRLKCQACGKGIDRRDQVVKNHRAFHRYCVASQELGEEQIEGIRDIARQFAEVNMRSFYGINPPRYERARDER